MPIGFPPQPRYPLGIDDDFTLYLVFNTSESPLTEDNQAWSDEIIIRPQEEGEPELWADNGFVNLDGELIYYDAVEKNADDRIYKFKRCARNLGGTHTKFNAAGTVVRGFVIAEHHNQLVDAIINLEEFVLNIEGRLPNVPDCSDDFCPDVTFDFEITNEDNCEGTTISYTIGIVGDFNTFLLEFGDGTSTTSVENGTHLYPPNSKIDPIVRVENSRCTIIQTAVIRDVGDQIQIPQQPEPLTIPIPEIPEIPPLIIPEITVPPIDVVQPPIVFPCIDLTPINLPDISIGPIDIQVPSVILITPAIPSIITVIPPILTPITVIPPILTPISVIPPNTSPISLIANIPSVISLIDNVPSVISLIAPTAISIIFPTPPAISVNWGTPPVISVQVQCDGGGGASMTGPLGLTNMGFLDNDDNSLATIDVDYDFVGIPSVIKVECPELPSIKFDTSNFVSEIKLTVPNEFPKEISFGGWGDVPTISITPPEEMPTIKFDTSSLPSSIRLELDNTINSISLVASENFPRVIEIDGSSIPSQIQVVGVPKTIELVFPKDGIPLLMPEKPEIEMVYRGSPIEVVLKMDDNLLSQGDGGYPCFALVPCNAK